MGALRTAKGATSSIPAPKAKAKAKRKAKDKE